MNTTTNSKYAAIAARTFYWVITGLLPEIAWKKALEEAYPDAHKRVSQEKHTCPKWAFCVLCHAGHVNQVTPGTSPVSATKNSGALTLKALELLKVDPSLERNRTELKRLVFGEKGKPGYRTPNNEIEVLLELCEMGEINR